jgi:hypothetical protein
MKFRVLRDVAPRDEIALIMEAVRTSETSVNFNVTTRHYIPEDSKLNLNIIWQGVCSKLPDTPSFISCTYT